MSFLNASEYIKKIQLYFSKKNFNEIIKCSLENIDNPNIAKDELNRIIATAYLSLKNYKKCLEYLNNSIVLNPNNEYSYSCLGLLYKSQNNFTKSKKFFLKALEINPKNFEIIFNYANLLKENKNYKQSLVYYEKCLEINANYYNAYINKAIILDKIKFYDKSLETLNHAIKVNPQRIEAYINLGNILKELKKYDQALKFYSKAFAINKNHKYLFGKIFHLNKLICKWDDYSKNLNLLEKLIQEREDVIEPLSLLSSIDNPSLQLKCSKDYVKNNFKSDLEYHFENNKKNKYIIAYFSSDFNDHAVSRLIMDIFQFHNRKDFKILAFDYGTAKNDLVTDKIRENVDEYIDIKLLSDSEAIKLCRSYQIDIAIDLNGHTSDSRTNLFINRVAKTQINFLGYPGTIGSKNYDYIIADRFVVHEDEQSYFTEKVIYLPDCYQPNTKIINSRKKKLSKEECSLPENSFVFCNFNHNFKITPVLFDSWIKILNNVPDSVLWLLRSNQYSEENLKKYFVSKKMKAERLIFADLVAHDLHLSRISNAHVALDTFPYTSHTTGSDILRSGVPLIALAGKSFASRVSGSLLTVLKQDKLIKYEMNDYISEAIKLGTNEIYYENIRTELISNVNNSKLYNPSEFAKNLEEIFFKILR